MPAQRYLSILALMALAAPGHAQMPDWCDPPPTPSVGGGNVEIVDPLLSVSDICPEPDDDDDPPGTTVGGGDVFEIDQFFTPAPRDSLGSGFAAPTLDQQLRLRDAQTQLMLQGN